MFRPLFAAQGTVRPTGTESTRLAESPLSVSVVSSSTSAGKLWLSTRTSKTPRPTGLAASGTELPMVATAMAVECDTVGEWELVGETGAKKVQYGKMVEHITAN